MENTHYLIFDFDGVLGDTWDGIVDFHMHKDELSRQEVETFLIDYYMQTKHSKNDDFGEEAQKKQQAYLNQVGTHVIESKPSLFTGFIEELKKLPDSTKMAVVSSGSTWYVKSLLAESGLNFSHILGFDDHHSKEEKIKLILHDWNVKPEQIFYFTDTLADYHELENFLDPTKIIGCAWGFQGYDFCPEQ